MKNNYATLESQLAGDVCDVGDTEEIFWLKMADDYQSKVKAGDLMVRQYRFNDAVREYENACKIKQNDSMLYIKMGGAYLTLFKFGRADACYSKALEYGANEGNVEFYLGVKSLLERNYKDAVLYFEKTNAGDDEMLISVIYWHTIASLRADKKPTFLEKYHKNINAGHHKAYKTAVSLFGGYVEYENIPIPDSALDAVIILYGIYEYLIYRKKYDEAGKYLKRALEYAEVWPCIAYLAAFRSKEE